MREPAIQTPYYKALKDFHEMVERGKKPRETKEKNEKWILKILMKPGSTIKQFQALELEAERRGFHIFASWQVGINKKIEQKWLELVPENGKKEEDLVLLNMAGVSNESCWINFNQTSAIL